MRRLSLLVLLALFVAPAACAQSGDAERQRNAPHPRRADEAMVVSGHPQATAAGLAVLRDGGNAIDAAVAVGFALAVVSPDAGNIGGGGFMALRLADGTATSIDFREKAPLGATADMYLDSQGEVVPYRSTVGPLASGVPGTVAGLLEAHEQYGALPRARLLEPAIRLAAEGQRLTARNASLFNRYRDEFAQFASTAKYFVPDSLFEVGETFVQADLAAVLRRIRDQGRAGFYAGETADLIVAQMERSGGLITHEDLARYAPVERPLVETDYRGYRVMAMAPPSSGGVAIAQAFEAVESYDLAAMPEADRLHLIGESFRRIYADRARWMSDPAFVEVPVEGLTDSLYVQRRMASFEMSAVTPSDSVRAGIPPGAPVDAAGELPQESAETTHYSIVDAEGNAVAVTTTINDYYGSKLVVDGAGFFLNDEMDDFTARPGVPNQFGLIQGEANAVAPEKRMVSSMTPTLVEDPEGRLFMVVGSPGGSRIITIVFQVISNVIDHGMNAQAAVEARRVHHQWLPDEFEYEAEGVSLTTREALREKGWTLDAISPKGAANVIVVRWAPDGTMTLEGGADPRRTDNTARGD